MGGTGVTVAGEGVAKGCVTVGVAVGRAGIGVPVGAGGIGGVNVGVEVGKGVPVGVAGPGVAVGVTVRALSGPGVALLFGSVGAWKQAVAASASANPAVAKPRARKPDRYKVLCSAERLFKDRAAGVGACPRPPGGPEARSDRSPPFLLNVKESASPSGWECRSGWESPSGCECRSD